MTIYTIETTCRASVLETWRVEADSEDDAQEALDDGNADFMGQTVEGDEEERETLSIWDDDGEQAASVEAQEKMRDAAPAMLAALRLAVRSHWLSIDYAHNRTPEACEIRSAMCKAIDAALGDNCN